MRRWLPALVLLLVLALATPCWAFLGSELRTEDEANYDITASGWLTGLYVSRVECSTKLTVVYFTNGVVLYKAYDTMLVLLAQNALYANRTVALYVTNNKVAAYRLR